MIARLLAAIGFPASAVGLTIYGMAVSESVKNESQANLGLAMLIGGFVVGMIGVAVYRAQEAKAARSHDS